MVGLHRSTVAMIRYGKINTDVATHLPRIERGCLKRSCVDCLHYTRFPSRSNDEGGRIGVCDMGFPESVDAVYGRVCAAFWPKNQ